jgi:hypothetical protein
MGFCGALAFGFGLTGGILTFKKQYFPLIIIGISTEMASGVVTSITFPNSYVLGAPILVLSIIGLIFTAISKNHFEF